MFGIIRAFVREYSNCLSDMKGMIQWVRRDLVPKDAYSIVKKLWICVFITQIIDLVLPLCISLVQNGSTTSTLIKGYGFLGGTVLKIQEYCPTFDTGSCYIVIGIASHLFLAAVLYNISAYYRFKLSEKMLYFNMWELSNRVTQIFFSKSVGTIDNEDNGLSEAGLRKGYDRVERIQNIAIFQLPESLFKTGLILAALILFYHYWQIRVIVLAMTITHFCWGVCLNYISVTTCEIFEEAWRYFNRYRNERWQQAKMVKINNKVVEEIKVMKNNYDTAGIPDYKFWGMEYNLHTRFRVAVIHIFLAMVFAYGAYLAKINVLTVGMLYPLFWWSSQLSGNLWQLADIENNFNKNAPSILLMKKALDLPIGIKMVASPVKMKKGMPMTIEFINATCSYPPDKDSLDKAPVVLKNINLKVCPGDKIGIVGPSGIGKSTLIAAALRFYDLIDGKILINGINIEEYDPYSLYDNVSYIGQTSENLDGTIEYNLEYGLSQEEAEKIPDTEHERLMEELDLCNGSRWAKGIKTVIGSHGKKLSGGQNQRVAIGRAITKRAPVLFGDEITSSVDSSTEKRVQKVLEKWLGEEITVFMVSHHYSTLRSICNKFVMIDAVDENDPDAGNSIVAEAGSLEELAQKCPKFRQMALDQDMVL
ncbi:MAG: ABC transporter ATP-binding protein [Candidatus Vogelbacteria bacterium]|nr:ABC transporter ATP-binding protein [Candidatus Vogelbacteria bacterium]